MLIITGSGRSGTETLSRVFGGWHEFRVNYILEKYFVNADPFSDPFDTIEKRIQVVLDLHQGIDPHDFIDSSNLYLHFIDVLKLLYPSVRIILSVRNGKDFVRSAASRKWHERKLFGMVPHYHDPYYNSWESLSPLQRNAWIWTYRNKKALSQLSAFPENQKFVLKIEDLNNPGVISRLETFAGILIKDTECADKKYNANIEFDFPAKETWTERQHREFDDIAGELMNYFKYD